MPFSNLRAVVFLAGHGSWAFLFQMVLTRSTRRSFRLTTRLPGRFACVSGLVYKALFKVECVRAG